MKWRKAEEVMEREVVCAAPSDSVRSIAMLMSQHNASCVAICEPVLISASPEHEHEHEHELDTDTDTDNDNDTDNSSDVRPIGIITERDIVQFQNLGLDLEQPAHQLMSRPLFIVSPNDSLWNIYQQMQRRLVRRLLVAGDRQELLGIITQQSLLQVFDPTEMYGVIEVLQKQVRQLESEQEKFLQERNQKLEQEVQAGIDVINTQNQELAFHMNNSPLAVVEWDSEFRVKRWSRRAAEIFGWQEVEVLGKHWLDWHFVFAEDREKVTSISNLLLDGNESFNISHNRNYTKDGSVIDCEWYNSVLLDEAGNLVSILSLAKDDTERQKAFQDRTLAKQELQISLKQQQVIAELGQFALAAKDLISISERVVELVASTLEVEYCKVLELTPEGKELILKAGVGWHDGLVGTARVRADTNSQAGYTLLQFQPVIVEDLNSETRFSGPSLLTDHQVVSGVSVIIPDTDKPYGILGIHSTKQRLFTQDDINFIQAIANIIAQANERLQAETALRAGQQKFDNILNSLQDIVWSSDARTFKLIYINQAAESIYGRQVSEFYQNDNLWLEAVHPNDRDRVAEFPDKTIEQGSYELEYRIVLPDGEIRWLLDRANLTRDQENRPLRLNGNSTDITQRKQVEYALRQSEQKFKVLFDQSFQFIGLLEPNGKMIEANQTALDFIGAKPADVRGKHFWDTPWWSESLEAQKLLQRGIERGATGEFIRFEVEHPGTGNRVVTVDFTLSPIKDETGKVLMLIPEGRNISDRKQAEADLKQSNQILQAISSIQTQFLTDVEPSILFDGMLESLLELTQSEYGFIGEIRIANDGSPIMEESYLKFRGRPYLKTHAITNIAWNDETRAFYAENAPKGMEFHNLETLFGAVMVTGEPVIANSPSTDPRRGGTPDGHPPLNAFLGVPFYKNAKMTGMVGIANKEGGYDEALIDYLRPFLDTCSRIIEAHQSDRQRQQAEAKNQEQAALLNVATDAIMVRNLDNQLLFWNRGAEKLYGWTAVEALEKDTEELLYRRSLTKLAEIQQQAIAKGEWQGELNQVTKFGEEIIVESRWTLVKDDAGNPQSFLVVNTNITEQKQLEAQFLRTQRLESLGTLAGGIAHDLNNILAPILGFSKLLPLKLPDVDEQTKGFFKIMENNANRGSALVKQILTFSRGLEGDKGIVQIRHLITEVAQIINETFPKSIELETNAPKNLWTVNADLNQLHQVLMNLSVNARDAMTEGGKLTIQTENITVDAEYARLHLDASEGAYVLITVTDTGAGIPPEVIDRIFEPFFTTKEVGRGTGLGLSTVIGIIKSHGGFVEVTSERNRKTHGTEFKVFLPASDLAENNEEPAGQVLQGNGELILVVDDETAILEVTKATLETYNYNVLIASNGIDAIAVYAQNQKNIAVVIMDIMMPSMDGKTAIRTLKKINPEVKIIAVSGLINRQEIVAEVDDDIAAYFAKPYSNEDLLETIHEIIVGN